MSKQRVTLALVTLTAIASVFIGYWAVPVTVPGNNPDDAHLRFLLITILPLLVFGPAAMPLSNAAPNWSRLIYSVTMWALTLWVLALGGGNAYFAIKNSGSVVGALFSLPFLYIAYICFKSGWQARKAE